MTSPSRAGLLLGGTLLVSVLAFGPAGAGGAAGSGVCEGVVVDQGSAGSVTVQGVNVAPGTSDLQALSAVNEPPTQNSSGLVCAINGYPTDGLQNCLATSAGGYDYWSYWQGDPYTNTWTYAAVGPASHTVGSGQTYVEGWRYQNPGPDNPSAPKPSVTPAAAFAQACPGVTPEPEAPSGGGGSSGGSGGAGSGGAGGGPSPPPALSTSPTTPVGSGSQSATRPTIAGGGVPVTTTTTHPGSAVAGVPANASAPSSIPTVGTRTAPRSAAEKAALAAAHHGSPGGGDPALPIVLVGLIIAALAGLTWWRWRSRPMEE